MPIDWSRSTVLSATEFWVVWDMLDLGHTPALLELLSPGATYPEHDRIVRDTVGALRERGLLHGTAPVPGLVADLTCLARPDVERDLVVTAPGRYAAVAATSGSRAVIAVRLDDRVALVRVPVETVTSELVGLAGPLRPGPGHTVRLPARVLTDAVAACAGDRNRFAAELMRHGVEGPDAHAVLRMSELAGVGQLGAGRRTAGGWQRAPYALFLHVTADGCYRQRRLVRPDGDTLVEAGPADSRALTRELDELVARAGRSG